MCNFIEDYLADPSAAIQSALPSVEARFSSIDCNDDMIYAQLSSPEFRLYEQITLSWL